MKLSSLPRVAAAVFLAALPVGLHAQEAQRNPHQRQGFVPDQAYSFDGVENISLFSRALVLTIPLGGTYPVADGFGYGLTAVYSANVWDLVPSTQPEPKQQVVTDVRTSLTANAGLGWRVSLGSLHAPGAPENYSETKFKYLGADGGEHVFYPTLHTHELSEDTEDDGEAFTRDGSYLRLRELSPTSYAVDFPGGTSHRFVEVACVPPPENPEQPCPYQLEAMVSAFGVEVTVETLPDDTILITDPHEREQRIIFTTVAGMRVVDRVELEAFDGSPAVYQFNYENEPDGSLVQVSCKDELDEISAPGGWPDTLAVPLLVEIVQPDGSKWEMPAYNRTEDCFAEGAVPDRPGTIAKLRLPTRGIYKWEYSSSGHWSLGQGHPPGLSADTSAGVTRRWHLESDESCPAPLTVDDPNDPAASCRWEYTEIRTVGDPQDEYSGLIAWFKEVTVRDPLGHKRVYHFAFDPSRNEIEIPGPAADEYTGWEYGLLLRELVFRGDSELEQQILHRIAELTGGPEEQRKALAALRDSVPVELRMFIRTIEKDGKTLVDTRMLNAKRTASSGNFQALRAVANSDKAFGIAVSVTAYSTSDGSGVLGNGLDGIFLLQGGLSPSKEMSLVLVGGHLGRLEAAMTLAHELRHAAFFAAGAPSGHEMGIFEESPGVYGAFDPNGPVNISTSEAEREAAANAFYPPN